MSFAGALPHSTAPYAALMLAGFAIGLLGHLARARWLVAVGVIVIFLAVLAFPLALNLFSDKPDAPGPLPRPY